MRYKEESGEWLFLNKAALLDPRFSRLVHLSPAQKHLVTESLSHELIETETDTDRTRQGEKSAAALGAMGSLFGDYTARLTEAAAAVTESCETTCNFLSVRNKKSSMPYWRSASQIVRLYRLCVPWTTCAPHIALRAVIVNA